MVLRDLRLRCFAQVLALGGMIFYAVLVPWHTVSQATANVVQPDGARAHHPCHQAAAKPNDSSQRSAPSAPRTKCPICKGFGVLHLAAGVPLIFVVCCTSEHEELHASYVQAVAKTDRHPPQNRGPPILPA